MTVKKNAQGTYSCVRCMADKTCIVKTPTGKTQRQKLDWYQHQYQAVRFLKLGIHVKGVLTPQVLEFSSDQVIETYQPGFPLSRENLENLNPKVQKNLAERLAFFLSEIHRISSLSIQSVLTIHFLKSSLYFKVLYLPTSFLKAYNTYFNLLKQADTSFQTTLCYRDLKAEHLLYDKETDMLSIIDFGNVDFDVPLMEFCLKNPIRSRVPLPFLKEVIDAYNKFRKHAPLDKNIIKAYLYCAAFNEIISVCKTKKAPLPDILGLGEILKDFLQELEYVFSSQ